MESPVQSISNADLETANGGYPPWARRGWGPPPWADGWGPPRRYHDGWGPPGSPWSRRAHYYRMRAYGYW